MADLVALRAELDKPAYAGLSDAAAAAAIMRAQIAADRLVPTAEIARLWARRNILGVARERTGRAALTPAQRALAWHAIEMVDRDGFADLDPRDAGHRAALVAFFDALVADTIMTAADKTATVALIAKVRPGHEVFGAIDENDVKQARAL